MYLCVCLRTLACKPLPSAHHTSHHCSSSWSGRLNFCSSSGVVVDPGRLQVVISMCYTLSPTLSVERLLGGLCDPCRTGGEQEVLSVYCLKLGTRPQKRSHRSIIIVCSLVSSAAGVVLPKRVGGKRVV